MKTKTQNNSFFVQSPMFLMTQYGLLNPSLSIDYSRTGKSVNLSNKNITFILETHPRDRVSTDPSTYIDQKCVVQSKNYQTGISEYAKEIAENFAHHNTPESQKKSYGILFTPAEIEVLYGPLLTKGYEQIAALVKRK